MKRWRWMCSLRLAIEGVGDGSGAWTWNKPCLSEGSLQADGKCEDRLPAPLKAVSSADVSLK